MKLSKQQNNQIEKNRGRKGLNTELYIEILQRISALGEIAPEIKELDINPLLANSKYIIAVDARILIKK